MKPFRVWAPGRKSVELDLAGVRIPMTAVSGGWWQLDRNESADYAFVLDGGSPLPDPRSAWQPNGVHCPSRRVDHAAFTWTDKAWQAPPLNSAVVYELHTGTFTPEGTFDAVIGRLDHLKDLGVTHLELMPVGQFDGERGWGYDGVALFAPHQAYGGPDGLNRLVDACHARDLAVILDVVYNHLGPSGNYLGQFGPYFTDRYGTPWGEAINLDGPGSDEVRRYLCDNALMWLRYYHVDGLRLDAVHAIFDSSAIHFLEQLSGEVEDLAKELGRPLVLIAESDLNDPRLLWPRGRGGYGLSAQWSDDFHHALHAVLTGETSGYYADFGRIADLAAALERVFVYDGRYSAFRQRRHGRQPEGLSGDRFLGYLQNHDQIGNRAQGERSSRLLSIDRLKIAAAIVLTAPFVPMLFQGEEWSAGTPFQYFTSFEDPELGRAVREGRRSEFAAFGWSPEDIPDPQDPATFDRSKLDWTEPAKQRHAEILDWHRRLIRLRADYPALRDGRLSDVGVRFDESERWLVVERGPIIVACNFSHSHRKVSIGAGKPVTVLLSSADPMSLADGEVQLAPQSIVILGPPGRPN